jgi:hypothetical protein
VALREGQWRQHPPYPFLARAEPGEVIVERLTDLGG